MIPNWDEKRDFRNRAISCFRCSATAWTSCRPNARPPLGRLKWKEKKQIKIRLFCVSVITTIDRYIQVHTVRKIGENVPKAKLFFKKQRFYLPEVNIQVQNGHGVPTWKASSMHLKHMNSLLSTPWSFWTCISTSGISKNDIVFRYDPYNWIHICLKVGFKKSNYNYIGKRRVCLDILLTKKMRAMAFNLCNNSQTLKEFFLFLPSIL